MLDAAILTALKDQRARLEKLRDDVESNGLMIPGGIVAAKSQEPLDEFLRMWFESKTGVILNSYCGSCSYTDIAKYEHDHFWLLLSQRTGFGHPTIRHDDVQVDGWHMFFSREWRTGASDDSRISDNERARSRYHNIAKELTELLVNCRYPFPFERNSWTSALFGLALDGHLIGKPLRKDFFRDKQLSVKDCWLAIIPNQADYSIAAIDWLMVNWPGEAKTKTARGKVAAVDQELRDTCLAVAKEKLRASRKRIVEMVCTAHQDIDLSVLAADPGILWGKGPWDRQWSKAQSGINKVLNEVGARLARRDSAVALASFTKKKRSIKGVKRQ